MLLAPARYTAFENEVTAIVGPRRISRSAADRTAYARDLWPRTLLAVRDGEAAPSPPDLIVWPTSTEEVARIVTIAVANRVPIVPFGAGSGVCGGATTPRGGVMLDMKRMTQLAALDEDGLTATFEAGINGEHLERTLAARGYTLGHFPSSIYCSTLGGWVAARSAGQLSTRYGKIEDMTCGLEVVTGTGQVLETGRYGRGESGPDWTQLFIGSEGTLGVITRARLRIHPAPEVRILRGIAFPRVSGGCEAIRRLLQRGLRPAVVRLYDELDTLMVGRAGEEHEHDGTSLVARLAENLPESVKGSVPRVRRWLIEAALERSKILNTLTDQVLPRTMADSALLIVGFEGPRKVTEAEARAGLEELRRAGGRDLGEAPGRHWLENRYKVSYRQSKVFMEGAWVDTMEVATTWDRLLDLYREVKKAVAPHAFVMAHFSHAYPEGCSIYFTFAGAGGGSRRAAEKRYDAAWRAGLSAAGRVGATISHHHGVGRSKAAFLPDEHRESLALMRSLKAVLDPHGVLNPGNLGLGGARETTMRLDRSPRTTVTLAPSGLTARLVDAVGAAHVAGPGVREIECYGLPSSALVCRPGSGAEVAEIVRACREGGAVVLVLGAGSLRDPSHALQMAVGKNRPVVLCDMRRMTNVLHLDETSLTVHVQAGILGRALENLLNPRGLTLGDHPPGALESTIGGLLATRQPGRASPRYGLLEDACLGLSAVLADGRTIHTRVAPRRATGPDLARILTGSEGQLGILTAATLRIHRRTDTLLLEGYELPGLIEAVRAARQVLRSDSRPSALRVVDAAPGDPLLPSGGALLFCALSGTAEVAAAEQAELKQAALAAGGRPAEKGAAEGWWRWRQTTPRFAVETLLPASHLVDAVRSVRAAATGAGATAVHAHLARFTRESACAYFVLDTPPDDSGAVEAAAVAAARQAATRAGGHLLDGRIETPALAELGHKLKALLDPDHLFGAPIAIAPVELARESIRGEAAGGIL
jgi:alkyldihydroxyacetonephosphate synthase